MKSKITDSQIIDAVKESKSISNVIRLLGLKVCGTYHRLVKRRVQKINIDTSHFTGQGHMRGTRKPYDKLKNIFVKGRHIEGRRLKNRLLDMGVENKCSRCGLTNFWFDGPLILEVHHKDKDHTNNELENLTILCPNCHTQEHGIKGKTKTNRSSDSCYICGKACSKKGKKCLICEYKSRKGRNKKEDKITKEELQKLIFAIPTSSIAKKFMVSDTAVSKWCKSYGIEKPPRGYWAKLHARMAKQENAPGSNPGGA